MEWVEWEGEIEPLVGFSILLSCVGFVRHEPKMRLEPEKKDILVVSPLCFFEAVEESKPSHPMAPSHRMAFDRNRSFIKEGRAEKWRGGV